MNDVTAVSATTVTATASIAATGEKGAAVPASDRCVRFGTYPECPLCGGPLHPEHAHFKCRSCGWRDSCCD